ncbi:MAG: family transcriptional regulator, cyclic receptor protein [Pseudonocardiales bacterium]|jgi:CRP-like cAMP-binding protein|nr:family transcriptional regulator, cyclic receptor protein [Pseudonocardiales bacterium]
MFTSTPVWVSDPQLADFAASHGENVEFPRRHVIFAQGEQGDRIYIIRSGKVKISLEAPTGQANLLALHGPTDVFGELSLFDPSPRASTATTVTEVQAVSLPYSTLRRQIGDRPELVDYMLRSLARQVRQSNANRAELVFADVPARAAKALLQLATRFGHVEGGALRVVHDLTQEELAQYIGATRETLNKTLSTFVQRGWLRVDSRSVLILDADRLRRRGR